MRVIAGKYKKRQLKVPKTQLTRPTTDKNKENLFNMIGPYFEGGTVLDLFGGSGSTLIAAEQSKRICYMMELDPKYCDVIVKRWESLTNKKAILEKR